jgi:enamine deaminase RidA (YjgF/YER057c/UK114 family)
MGDIVKITIFVTDPSYRPAVAAARLKWFKEGEWPASTYLVVSALAVPTMLVEIEAVAMI